METRVTQAFAELRDGSSVRFVASFIAWLTGFAVLFETGRAAWVHLYMVPLTRVTQVGLGLFGLPAKLVMPDAGAGFCLLQVGQFVYQVTFECTGIFALFLCAASILAFPVSVSSRLQGLLVVIPAFISYSVMRLIVLGLVAHWSPSHIDLFHLYIMVVANVGFVLAMWLYWLRDVAQVRLP
jgi:exosortase/archaeosortase family protein